MRGTTVLKLLFLITATNLFAVRTEAQRDNDPLAPGSFYEISGQIRSADNRPVENVMVRVESSTGALVDQGTADNLGRFRFVRLRPGQYKVFVSATGLTAPPQSVDLSRVSPRVHVLIQLVPESPTFRAKASGHAGVVDARVPADARAVTASAVISPLKSETWVTSLSAFAPAFCSTSVVAAAVVEATLTIEPSDG